jgi:hypothetical protein
MGIKDRLFGQDTSSSTPTRFASADDRAVERYRYLLRTAPPDSIEQAHEEAFARLSPEQRKQVLRELGQDEGSDASPHALARIATRAEMRQPGTLERALGGGVGLGGVMAGSLLGSIAGSFIGTAIAQQLLDGFDGDLDAMEAPEDFESARADDASGLDGDFGGDFLDV